MAERLSSALSTFDAWAIYDRRAAFVENPTGGLMSRYFDQLWDEEYRLLQRLNKAPALPIGQLLIMTREDDRRSQQTIDGIRNILRERCLPIFHFRDGQILFFCSTEPARIVMRRCERHLARLEHWAIVDSNGDTCASNERGESIWVDTDLELLTYRDEDVEDDEDVEV